MHLQFSLGLSILLEKGQEVGHFRVCRYSHFFLAQYHLNEIFRIGLMPVPVFHFEHIAYKRSYITFPIKLYFRIVQVFI